MRITAMATGGRPDDSAKMVSRAGVMIDQEMKNAS
jgi:hypothetical protein